MFRKIFQIFGACQSSFDSVATCTLNRFLKCTSAVIILVVAPLAHAGHSLSCGCVGLHHALRLAMRRLCNAYPYPYKWLPDSRVRRSPMLSSYGAPATAQLVLVQFQVYPPAQHCALRQSSARLFGCQFADAFQARPSPKSRLLMLVSLEFLSMYHVAVVFLGWAAQPCCFEQARRQAEQRLKDRTR